MNLEEENREKRKQIPLTREEWLTYFFLPFESKPGLDTNTFNEVEDNRFEKFGFDKKMKQASEARMLGSAFYTLIFVIIIAIMIW